MKVLVVVDGHLVRTPDGKVWSSRIYNYEFFSRYLSAFEKVKVAIRMKDVANNEGYPNLCSGKNVEFFSIEEFRGPKEYLKKYKKVNNNAINSFEDCDCAIFRVPSTVGFAFMKKFRKTKKPYALEVVIDPWDFAAPGMLKTPFRSLIRLLWTLNLKSGCLKANGVSYVTKEALQKRYPSFKAKYGGNSKHFESFYSSVNIENDYFNKPHTKEKLKSINLIHVSNVIGNYVKGHKELIEATSKLIEEKYDVNVTFVGEGPYVDKFKEMCVKYNVMNKVNFIGKISDKYELRSKLIENDIFVFPSHAEGLPRVLIEAMAVGLPCISTKINGIPELLEDKYLTSIGDVNGIVKIIKRIHADKNELNNASIINYNTALKYSEELLQIKRKDFYNRLKECVKEEKDFS